MLVTSLLLCVAALSPSAKMARASARLRESLRKATEIQKTLGKAPAEALAYDPESLLEVGDPLGVEEMVAEIGALHQLGGKLHREVSGLDSAAEEASARARLAEEASAVADSRVSKQSLLELWPGDRAGPDVDAVIRNDVAALQRTADETSRKIAGEAQGAVGASSVDADEMPGADAIADGDAISGVHEFSTADAVSGAGAVPGMDGLSAPDASAAADGFGGDDHTASPIPSNGGDADLASGLDALSAPDASAGADGFGGDIHTAAPIPSDGNDADLASGLAALSAPDDSDAADSFGGDGHIAAPIPSHGGDGVSAVDDFAGADNLRTG